MGVVEVDCDDEESHHDKNEDGSVQLGHRLRVKPSQVGELGVDKQLGGQPLQKQQILSAFVM